MDKRHSPRIDTAGVHPVMTMAGIMPGGSEMRHWHNWVPFPDPDAIARDLAAGKAREVIGLTDTLGYIVEKREGVVAS